MSRNRTLSFPLFSDVQHEADEPPAPSASFASSEVALPSARRANDLTHIRCFVLKGKLSIRMSNDHLMGHFWRPIPDQAIAEV